MHFSALRTPLAAEPEPSPLISISAVCIEVSMGAMPAALPHHQHRQLAVREYFVRFASQHDALDAAASVRSHDNQVAAGLLCRPEDGFVRMQLQAEARFAGDACFLRFRFDFFENAPSALFFIG